MSINYNFVDTLLGFVDDIDTSLKCVDIFVVDRHEVL